MITVSWIGPGARCVRDGRRDVECGRGHGRSPARESHPGHTGDLARARSDTRDLGAPLEVHDGWVRPSDWRRA